MTSTSRRVTVSVRMALAGLIMLCMASGIRLRAQTVTGTVLGIVLDTSGAVVPNAQITITNQDTGVVRAAATSADGLYNIPSLEAGNYTVDAKALGFNPVQVRNVVVTVGSSSRVDLRLQVGSTTQSVIVTEAVPTVETTSSEVSQVMNEDFIKEIPLNARDLQQLAVIQPGVQWMNTGFGGTAMTVAGDRPTNNRFLQEGMDMTWTYRLSPISLASNVLLGVEATKEFKVITTNYTADYGEQSGGVISTIFKSGTNTLHGSAYEYYRNSVFDARNFFDQDPRRHSIGINLAPQWADRFARTKRFFSRTTKVSARPCRSHLWQICPITTLAMACCHVSPRRQVAAQILREPSRL